MTRRRGRLAAVLAVLLASAAVLLAPAAMAQDQGGLLTIRGIDATDKDAIDLTFLWTGPSKDLESLTMRENGESKKVESLTSLGKTDQRLATVVVVDLSGSMDRDSTLTQVKAGIAAMADDLGDGDQLGIVSYSDEVVVETELTSSVDQIDSALDAMASPKDGKTATYDALRRGTKLFEDRPNHQPNLVLLTDGADDASSADLAQARASVAGSGAALFAIELDHLGEVDASSIDSIIDRTGGASFKAKDGPAVEDAFADLTKTMGSQFVVRYASKVDQGAVDLSLSVGSVEEKASYVAGGNVKGAATELSVSKNSAFGPSWLRGSGAAIGALLLLGLAVGLGAYSFGSLATRDNTGLNAALRPYAEGPVGDPEADGALAQTALLQRAVELTEDFAERQGFLQKVELALERADLPLRAAEALFFYAAGVLVIGLLGLVTAGFVGGLLIMVVGALLPPAVVNFMANRRGKVFQTQLPDTLHLLSGSLRAGYSFLQGVEAVSLEVEEPMGKELRRVITEARLGREVEDAMDAVAERMGSADFAWAVMAVRIQREVGGNLSELLLTVADTMVHRDRLRRDVAALTAEGKMSAIILGLLPIGLGAFMWMSNPKYMSPLSTTGMGQVLLGVAILSAGIGFLWMKKTITIEI